MAATHFAGLVYSAAGFVGDLTGSQVGYAIFPAATDYAADGAIGPGVRNATLSKGSAATMTLAAPGAAYVGWFLLITSTTNFAHQITITGLNTSTVITLPASGNPSILLLATSATTWQQLPTYNVPIATKVTGAVTGNVTGNQTGIHYDAAAPTAYSTGVSQAIDPSIAVANITKTTPAGSFTLAVPGAANINKFITVFTTTAYAHVTTVTGLLGGTTLTMAAAAGSSFTLYAVSASVWVVVALNGVTQTA
jgi:hypothetical protein